MKDITFFLKSHKYYLVVAILVLISVVLNVTFSSYIVTSNDHKAAEMYIGELKYSISIDSNETNTITVPSGETIIDLNVNNLNPVDTYYKLLYLNNSNITIKYYNETKDTSEVVTKYNKPNDSITSSGTNSIKLSVVNNSSSNQTISFSLKGGYINNTLSDIKVPSGYREINKEDTSTNTYFCYTDSTLQQGTTYSDNYFKYAYKQEAHSNGQMPSTLWVNSTYDGWGVALKNISSTDAFNGKMCTYINDEPILSASYAFFRSAASSIDTSNINTKNIKNMAWMFFLIRSSSLNISNLNTENSILMNGMFSSNQVATLDLGSFDTSNVTNMSNMFQGSTTVSVNFSNFNTSNVTDMSNMFNGSGATTLDISHFDTRNVTNMSNMFYGSSATTLDLSHFDTSKVTDMSSMFSRTILTSLDLSGFNTSKVTNMSHMFYDSSATTLDLSHFDTSKVTDMSSMFSGSKATTINISNFDTSNVTNMASMFKGSNATTLDMSNIDTSKVTNMNYMFSDSTNLKTIYVSDKFNTNKVTLSNKMFDECVSLVGGSGTKYNSSYVDKTYAHIDGGTSSPGYFTDIAEKDFPTKAGIYIRNSSPKGLETVSRDGLYRFVGSSNNYVSMGGVSYRIIGITDDSEINSNLGIEANQLKLIKTTPIEKKEWVSDGTTDYPWGVTSNTLYWHLQQDILSNTSYIPSSWNSKISLVNWYIGDTKTGSVSSISSSERSTVTSKQSKLGLMYLSDYFYSNVAGGTTNCYTTKCSRSWLNNSSKTQWTMSRYGAMSNMGYFAWTIETTYNNSPLKVNNTSAYYSPVFFLDKTIYISGGSGTSSDPFILEYNKDYYFVTVYLTGNYYGLYRVKKGNEINLSIYSGNPLKYSTCSNAKYSLSVDSNKINHITIKSITDDAYCYLEYNF